MSKTEDKRALKKAALSRWIAKLQESADRACEETDSYDPNRQATLGYVTIIEKLRDLAEDLDKIAKTRHLPVDLDKIAKKRQPVALSVNTCDSDDDCPDGQICVSGVCESAG